MPTGSAYQPRWLTVKACPACGNAESLLYEVLRSDGYRLGDETIEAPEYGVRLVRCQRCGLAFKDTLPSPEFLEEVFTRQAGKVWADSYDFLDEKRMILELAGDGSYDVLDVGASNGGFLKALGGEGRRSALDIVMHPGLERHLRGEFVWRLADSDRLSWSEEPYDVVTMFDVAEHLYHPDRAFANMHSLLKPGGFLVIETGDVDSPWPHRYGAGRWWYVGLFEHHVFWSERSLEAIAKKNGFEILNVQRKRHKSRTALRLRRDALDVAKVALYRATAIGFEQIARASGKKGTQPWSPFVKDHVRVVLRRN